MLLHAVEPATFSYYWQTDDGQSSGPQQLVFPAAGDKALSATINLSYTAPNIYGVRSFSGKFTLYETSPNVKTWPYPYSGNGPSCSAPPTPPPTP
jgi:hypothetical protein